MGWRRIVQALFFVCVAALLFAQAMQRPLDHDEHQFVASGWLIAHAGMLPYRDFPYFHLPYLSLLYALLDPLTTHRLLAARLLSAVAALASALLIYRVLRGDADNWRGFGLGAAAALVWLLNPITQYASGLAWNHDSAGLCGLLAFAFFVRPGPSRRDNFLSGLCLALAIGIRSAFVLAIIAFVAVAWFEHARISVLGVWLAGLGVGLLPILYFFVLAPAQFIFGNWTYAALNTQWRIAHEYERAMTLPDKFGYFASDVVGPSSTLLILIAFVLALWMGWRWRLPRGFWLACALSGALFVSALLPTPTFEQYFFACVPFVVLSVGLAFRNRGAPALVLMFALVLISLPQGAAFFTRAPILLAPEQWTPIKTHQVGQWVRERAGDGAIVTLAPVIALEADLPIYPELATGPFAYRVGALLSADERQRQHIFTIDDLSTVLDARPPRALLLGFEPEELEEPLAEYAQRHQYRYQKLPDGKNLWIRP